MPKTFNLQKCILTCLLPVFLFSACKFFPYNVRVSGRVLDTAGMKVAGAAVAFDSGTVETVSESDGAFQVKLVAGEHRLTISVQGKPIYNQQVVIPAAKQFNLGDLRPDRAFFQSRFVVREQGQYDYHYDYQQWCAVSVADGSGRAVTSLGYDDFEITESMVRISDGAVVAQQFIPLKEQSGWRAYDLGLFERSVGSEKLDIVFLADRTGSFDDDGTDVRGEVKHFVQQLATEHIDFRVAGVNFGETPDGPQYFDFCGPEQIDLIPEKIDSVLHTEGDWWDPTCAYDALLFTHYLGFRPDARRVAVILTDIVPQTVYGTFWYSIDASIATRSAVEQFLAADGIELYYAVFEHTAPDIQYYWQPDKNPRAGETGNPAYGIEGSGLSELRWSDEKKATRLTWPFTAGKLWEKLALTTSPLKDSLYMMCWFPVIDRDDIPGALDQYDYKISISVKDPENPGQSLSASYQKPASHPTATAEIQLVDEEGNPFIEAYGWLYVERAGRATDALYHQAYPDETGALVFTDLVPQRYVLLVTDYGSLKMGFSNLRAIARLSFEVPPEGTSLTLTVQTADRTANEAVLAGLLHDLEDWRLSGSPYRNIVGEINDWLYDCCGGGILCDGMNWREQAALRHLTLVLGGYANLNEYSQLEAQRAVEDFQNIILQIGRLVQEIRNLQGSTEQSWKEALAAAGFRAALDLATAGQAEVIISGVEALLKQLTDYLTDEFFYELVNLMKQKIMAATGIEAGHPVATMIDTSVELYHDWEFSEDSEEHNLDLIWGAAQKLSLQLFIDRAIDSVSEKTVQDVFTRLPMENAVERALKPLLKDLVQVMWRGVQFENFSERLKTWAEATGQMLSAYSREQILTAIDSIFAKWSDELEQRGVPENFSDFVLGFFREIAKMAVPELKNGKRVSALNIDEVTAVLIKHAVYNIFLRDRFVDDFQTALSKSFTRVQAIAATHAQDFDRWQWRSLVYNTLFRNFRSAIGDAQDVAWDALEKQRDIQLWADGLTALQSILQPLGEYLDIAASVYYPLQDASDAVHAFSATLDSIQVVVQSIEFGLKLKGLEKFGELSQTVYLNAFE